MSDQLHRQQQALAQHEKMVAMGQMAAGVTHEIANPLASMDSVLQLAQRRPERLTLETVRTLREQVQRINEIIRQMKAFAHPAEDNSSGVASVNAVVDQAIGMLRFDARLKRTEVRRDLDAAGPVVDMSPQALQQVLVNLIINALDATSAAAAPRLTVRTRQREQWCLIEVADNGHGVDAQHMPRLFEPFFTTKPVGKGTGLGLSISYSLMQRQGGSISVRSRSGEGATFTLRLPAHVPTPRPAASRPRESVATPISGAENRAT
jgi:C4-dicarboxylate-specific signal transduction histidine kinase